MWPASVTERLEAASSLDGLKPAVSIRWLKASSTHLLSPRYGAHPPEQHLSSIQLVVEEFGEAFLWNDIHATGLTLTPKLL